MKKTDMTDILIQEYAQNYKKRCEEYVFKHTIKCKKLGVSDEDNPLELFQRMAEKRREMTDQPIFERITVEDITDETDCKFPILIEEIYVPQVS